jgi:hypothetical protein
MKRIQMQRPKVRGKDVSDPLPDDPRDPDILRAKQLAYARQLHDKGGSHS